MTDRFTITLDYDRDKIITDAKMCIAEGGDMFQTKSFLDTLYPAWKLDLRTACIVELMFRDEDDPLHEVYTEKLAGTNPNFDVVRSVVPSDEEARRVLAKADSFKL